MSRFFVALLPPQHIQDCANEIKQYFADRYASSGAQKSPPHITLQPPFEWVDSNVSFLEDSLKKFASRRSPVPVTLHNFAAFAPRVIYIDVVQTPELMDLQADLMAYVESNLGIVDKVSQTRSFTPHMTVAFRDLTKQNFKIAWTEFEKRELHFEFKCDRLTLLLHDGKRWNVKTEFSFVS
ncbi:MAG: 2'-5' RNA ligase family protein [Tolypothrix carrinoi HA7290-LM1]|nr:2'-5' RNA ligase family protein [Tolypothrix carrinoi HA7290-LM1]